MSKYYALSSKGPVVRKSPYCGWDKLTPSGWEDVDVQRVHENAYEITIDEAREIAQRINPVEAENL